MGALNEMYAQFGDVAEFRIVYIGEAHAADGRRPVGYAKERQILEHRDYAHRCTNAARMLKEEHVELPCIVDTMDKSAQDACRGMPTRLFIVGADGKLAVVGRSGPRGLKPAIGEARQWLGNLKKSGESAGGSE